MRRAGVLAQRAGKGATAMFLIGNHVSSSKGYLAMGKQAAKLGGNTFAFFTRNPRGGAQKPQLKKMRWKNECHSKRC